MCWPPHTESSIHDHEESSCFVAVVEGSACEVQYRMPVVDRQFLATEMKNPTGAVGRCGRLTKIAETALGRGVVQYANNDLAGMYCTLLKVEPFLHVPRPLMSLRFASSPLRPFATTRFSTQCTKYVTALMSLP